MPSIAKRLQTLGIELPAARKPAFSYSAVVIDAGLAWISGQLPWLDDSVPGLAFLTVYLFSNKLLALSITFNA